MKSAVRRGIGKVEALDRVVIKRSGRRDRSARLVKLYDRLRENFTMLPATPASDPMPEVANIDRVEHAVLAGAASSEFVRVITTEADVDLAFVTIVRGLIGDAMGTRRARSVAHVLQNRDGLRAVGDVCLALVVMQEPMNETAWELFGRNDVALSMRLAPYEYFQVGFELEPRVPLDTLRRVMAGELDVTMRPAQWLEVARSSFASGAEDLSALALTRAEGVLSAVKDERRGKQLRAEIAALRSWFGRRGTATTPLVAKTGEIPFAVFDYQQAGRAPAAIHGGDALNTLAVLANLVRRQSVRFSGDAELVGLAEALRARVVEARRIDGDAATVRLVPMNRDASSFDPVPEGTWTIVSGLLLRQVCGLRYDLPFNSRVRPIFLGVEITPQVLHGDGVIAYLQQHAPIGCRDWRTVFLLHAAGIPAFFSGWLVQCIDTVAGDPSSAPVSGRLPKAVVAALERVERHRGRTNDLGTYLAARSIGVGVDFRPDRPGDLANDGLANVPDTEFEATRQSLLDLTSSVLTAILSGRSSDEVYALWRESTAPAVARAAARQQELPVTPPPIFDVAAAVRDTLAASVSVERSEPGPSGSEINIEFSLDGNFKHPLDVVLDSIVTRSSRPIHAYVLCRDHGPQDFKRMAALFPTVSFTWLPTDHADYGNVTSMLRHITVATMDRLLLPDLLPGVDRIIHHDLDALCQADIAELFDIDMGDAPIAARDQRHPFRGSGYIALTGMSVKSKTIDLSREMMVRLTTSHPFDFRNFNAGILVLNLARMRADNFTREYLPLIERFGFNDQGVLNVYAGSRAHAMSRSWNAYPRYELVDDAKILHWLGPPKPWHPLFIEGQPLWRAAEASFAARAKAAGIS